MMTNPRPRRWRVLIVVGAAYAIFLALVWGRLTDRLILYPTRTPLAVGVGLARTWAGRGAGGAAGAVEIWVARSRGAGERPAQAYVLTFVGNAARAELTAPFFAKDWGDRPVEVWSVNYPGYGSSPGAARLGSIAPAALAAYDELRGRVGDRPIFLEARSIGTAAALYVAARRPDVAGCILHNPPPLKQLIVGRYGWWNLELVAGPVALTIPTELDSLANAGAARAPAVFVLAEGDAVVPVGYQRRVAEAYGGPKRVVCVPGASHTGRAEGAAEGEYQAGIDWLWGGAVGKE